MARTPSHEYSTESMPTSKTQVVGIRSNTKRAITKITFINNSGGVRIVQLYMNLSGAQEIPFLIDKQLANKETWSCMDAESQVLEQNGTISVSADGANVCLSINSSRVT